MSSFSSVGSIGGPHSNDTRSGTPSGIVGGMQRQLSSDGLERPPSMGGGSCKDEGSIGGQLLNGAEAGGPTGDSSTTISNNVGNTICDNNTTTNNHTNNRLVTGQNTPDGCGLSENPGSTSSSGGGVSGQSNANHNLNPLSNGPSGTIDDGSGNQMGSCMNSAGTPNSNNIGNSNNHLNSSLEDVKPSHLGSSSNSSTPQHQVLNTLPNDSDSFLDAFDTKEESKLFLCKSVNNDTR